MYLNRDEADIYIHACVFVHFKSVIHIEVLLS